VFLTREPAEAGIRAFVAAQSTLPFSYAEVGATREGVTPKGYYAVDRYRVKLGEGEAAYRRAVEALRGWRQFDLGWASIVPRGASLEVGTTVAVLARHFGFWSLNSVRVVYLVEGTDRAERFGFAYGTLPGHGEKGEERFVVERDRESGTVYYDVLAFSRPNHTLAWLGYPFARALQRRFAHDSKRAMVRAAAA
jgi:uncharacterized protein (UPF0548 family)